MIHRSFISASRQGTVLIIIAGICALLAALSLAFLTRMRSDIAESQLVIQYAQAKIMLAAGCNYIQETSRIGWEGTSKTTPMVDGYKIHEEAYGWVDVRTGRTGPFNREHAPLAAAAKPDEWPHIGTHVRCPMFVRKIPPYATKLNTGFNPIRTDEPSSPEYCYPLLRYPDPQPVIDNKWTETDPSSVSKLNYTEFEKGDPTPIQNTLGKAWFRVFRDGPATFIVTCGSGGTNGFKNWEEVKKAGQEEFFGGSTGESTFYAYQQSELRLHYRLEWTAAGVETSYHNLQNEIAQTHDLYISYPPNSSHTWGGNSRRTNSGLKSPVGTIRWIQRLLQEPKFW